METDSQELILVVTDQYGTVRGKCTNKRFCNVKSYHIPKHIPYHIPKHIPYHIPKQKCSPQSISG